VCQLLRWAGGSCRRNDIGLRGDDDIDATRERTELGRNRLPCLASHDNGVKRSSDGGPLGERGEALQVCGQRGPGQPTVFTDAHGARECHHKGQRLTSVAHNDLILQKKHEKSERIWCGRRSREDWVSWCGTSSLWHCRLWIHRRYNHSSKNWKITIIGKQLERTQTRNNNSFLRVCTPYY